MNEFNLPLGIDAQQFINKAEFISSNHSHPYYEFLFVHRASFNYLVGEKIITPVDYSLVLVNTNTVHKAVYANCKNNSYLIFKFYEKMVDICFREQVRQLFQSPLLILSIGDRSRIEYLVRKLYQEFLEKQPNYTDVLVHQLNELLVFLYRSSQRCQPPVFEHEPSVIEEAIVYLNEKIFTSDSRELSLERISERFHLSPSAFSRQFKKTAGIGFKQFLTSVKIGQAKELLSSSDLSITEIAFQCGFTDSNYFTYVFKKIESITPTEYAKFAKNLRL